MAWNPWLDPRLIVLLGIAALAIATVLVLRSETIGRWWWRVPVWLVRAGCLALLCTILANPVRHRVMRLGGGSALNVVLVDTSESMALEKPVSRFDRALEWSRVFVESAPAGQTCRVLGFSDEVKFEEPPRLAGTITRLGEALRRVLESNPDANLANVFVLSDGRIHDRDELTPALALAQKHGVRISTHTIGRDDPPLNIFIRACRVERTVPSRTRVPVDVEIGCVGPMPRAALEISLKDEQGAVVAQAPITLRQGSAEKQLTLEAGLRTAAYTVSVTRLSDELTHLDNDFTFTLEIADPKIRVFLAEGSKTVHEVGDEEWAAGRLFPAAFRRAGDIECDVFQMVHQNTPGAPLYFVTGFDRNESAVLDRARGIPREREGWWQYDVVIISDIARQTFSPEQMEWVRQLVAERGGGFCMIGGNLSFDTGSFDQTLWEKLIPVDCLEYGFGHGWRGTTPRFPKEVRAHPILQITADPALNDAILDAHPMLLGYHDIRRAKPGATTLACVADNDAPLIAVQDYGRGRTMAFLSDAAGGWGDGGYQGHWGPAMLGSPPGDETHEPVPANEYYNRFWVNAVRWLAENSLRRGHKALLGRTGAVTVRPGEVVKVAATLLHVFDPAELPKQSVGARLGLEGHARVPLAYDRDKKEFVGALKLPDAVATTELPIVFDSAGSAPPASDEIRVRVMQLNRELADPRPDRQLMADIAQATGGAVLETPREALAALSANQKQAATEILPYTEPVWNQPWLWALLLALFGTEWILRRVAPR